MGEFPTLAGLVSCPAGPALIAQTLLVILGPEVRAS